MMDELKPCPFCGNVNPELVDSRVEFFVRCNQCKPFFTVVYGKNVRHLDHITADTDEEADRLSQIAFDTVDWDEIKQSAIDAWNTRADGWISVGDHPNCSGRYTVHSSYGVRDAFFSEGFIVGDFRWQDCETGNDEGMENYNGIEFEVYNWMALPLPPKAAK